MTNLQTMSDEQLNRFHFVLADMGDQEALARVEAEIAYRAECDELEYQAMEAEKNICNLDGYHTGF